MNEPLQLDRDDRSDVVGTRIVLAAVADHDPSTLDRLHEFALEAVAAAVRREILAGNLSDGLTITPQGRATLNRLRGSVPRHLDVRRSLARGAGHWQITCSRCGVVAGDIGDDELEDAVVVGVAHVCRGDADREVHLLPDQLR